MKKSGLKKTCYFYTEEYHDQITAHANSIGLKRCVFKSLNKG